jgi:hypothetical protein
MAKPKSKPGKKAARAVAPAARARVGYQHVPANKVFVRDTANVFKLFGDKIGDANPNKTVDMKSKKHRWVVTNPPTNNGANTTTITATPKRIRKAGGTHDGGSDDLTITIIFDEGTENEEAVDVTFNDVEFEDP